MFKLLNNFFQITIVCFQILVLLFVNDSNFLISCLQFKYFYYPVSIQTLVAEWLKKCC